MHKRKVVSADYWQEIRLVSKNVVHRKAAIAFVTKNLLDFGKGDVLITNASLAAIRRGQTKAKLLLKMYDDGVALYNCPDLHGKVLLLDDTAVIGSGNMSDMSNRPSGGWQEAGFITNDEVAVAGVTSFIEQLMKPEGARLSRDQLVALTKIKVTRKGGWGTAKKRRKKVAMPGNQTWIAGVSEAASTPEEEKQEQQVQAQFGGEPAWISSFSLQNGLEVETAHRPFFIIGSGRCGTTLMRRLIVERSGATIPPENLALGVSSRHMAEAREDWHTTCELIIAKLMNDQEAWKLFQLDSHEVLASLRTVPVEFRSVQNFWHVFHAIYASKIGKSSLVPWGDKTPANATRLRNILELFPDAKFIFMVRDVFDVAYSYASMSIKGRQGQYLEGAQRWVGANTRLVHFAKRRPEQAMFVHYGKLVAGPETVIEHVLKFLSLPSIEPVELSAAESFDIREMGNLRNSVQRVSVEFSGKGRANLSQEAKDEISKIAAPLQIYFRYEPTGAV